MTTKWSKTSPSVVVATLAQAFKVNFHFFITPIPSHTYIILPGYIGYNWNIISNFALYQTFYSSTNSNKILLLLYLTHKTLNPMTAN